MKKHRLYDDEIATPLDYTSPEDIENDIHDQRYDAALPQSAQDSSTEDQDIITNSMLSSKPRPHITQFKDGPAYPSVKSDAFADFSKAKAQIEELKDELLQDYYKDKALGKANKVLEIKILKAKKGTKSHQEIPNLVNDRAHLPDDKVALEYPETLPDETAIPEYIEKLPDETAIPEFTGKLLDDKAVSEYTGKMKDNKATHKNHGKLDSKAVLEYSRKLPHNKATYGYSGEFPNNKVVSEYYDTLLDDDKSDSRFQKKLAPRKIYPRPIKLNSFYHSSKVDDFNTRKKNDGSQSSSFEKVQNKENSQDLEHQLELALASAMNQKDTKMLMDSNMLNSDDDIWFGSSAPIALAEQESVVSSLGRKRTSETPKIETFETVTKIYKGYENKIPDKKKETLQNRLENNINIYLNKITSDEKVREQGRKKNQTLLIHNIKHTDDYESRTHGFTTSSLQKSVSQVKNQTHGAEFTEHADSTTKSSRNILGDNKNAVSVEKRRGNMAAKYRKKNKKTHHKHRPKPQPPPTEKPMPESTTQIPTASTSQNMTNFTEDTSTWTTGAQSNMTVAEIIDSGKDKIDLPLSGTPSWHALIHGRRDIVLAGAIMGGIGMLLIILSMIYMIVSRRNSHQKKNKNNSRAYQRLGSDDEKVRLTKTKRSLLSSSSEGETSDESDDDTEQHRVKKKKAVNYLK